MLIVRQGDVSRALDGAERDVLRVIRGAYLLHDSGESAVPHSVFLRFPGDVTRRIIGLPAFAGGDAPVAGMKWIASFPGNIERGLPRASAAILLNSLRTGRPTALLEGSLISARRTAASAALAAGLLVGDQRGAAGAAGEAVDGVGVLGCGVINREVLRFLAVELPELKQVTVFDQDPVRAAAFAEDVEQRIAPGLEVRVASERRAALSAHGLVSVATTSGEPHLGLEEFRAGAVVLHLSLRDLYPEAVLAARNVVDDVDHVCRERTSLHLAEQASGGRGFIEAEIGALLRDGGAGAGGYVRDPERVTVFSPFGLGVLDMVLADWVRGRAEREGFGVRVDGFLDGDGAGEGEGS